jgi:hypothetical protein
MKRKWMTENEPTLVPMCSSSLFLSLEQTRARRWKGGKSRAGGRACESIGIETASEFIHANAQGFSNSDQRMQRNVYATAFDFAKVFGGEIGLF